MGEAKRNAAARAEQRRIETEKIRDDLLKQTDNWSFEPREWEVPMVAAIRELRSVQVYRPSAEAMAYARMPPRRCFENAEWYSAQNPSISKPVIGWIADVYGNYTLHAVNLILRDGLHQDWTPVLGDARPSYPFIPDPHLVQRKEVLEDRVRYHHERDGHAISYGIRSDPQRTLRHIAKFRADLLAGMDPIKAASQPLVD